MPQNIHAHTGEVIQSTNLFTGDNESYEMLPDNTLIKCQFISHDGKFVKADDSLGEEIVSNVRVMDQRIFWSNILYACEYPIGSGNVRYTRASLLENMTQD